MCKQNSKNYLLPRRFLFFFLRNFLEDSQQTEKELLCFDNTAKTDVTKVFKMLKRLTIINFVLFYEDTIHTHREIKVFIKAIGIFAKFYIHNLQGFLIIKIVKIKLAGFAC